MKFDFSKTWNFYFSTDGLFCPPPLCLTPPHHHRPNSFVMITANRVLHCNADTPEEMHHWITLLQRSKGDTRVDGQEFIIRGKDGYSLTDHQILLIENEL